MDDPMLSFAGYQKIEEEITTWKKRYELVIPASGQLVYEYHIVTGTIEWGNLLRQVLGLPCREEFPGSVAESFTNYPGQTFLEGNVKHG
jgi:hypothetical protein